jgi:hypothetical protein
MTALAFHPQLAPFFNTVPGEPKTGVRKGRLSAAPEQQRHDLRLSGSDGKSERRVEANLTVHRDAFRQLGLDGTRVAIPDRDFECPDAASG